MKQPSFDNNPYRPPPPTTSSGDVESAAAKRTAIGQRIKRALFLILSGTVVGAVIGLFLWWLTTTAWSQFEGWWWPTVSRGSGGDPIANWAKGFTRMFLMLAFVIPSTAIGFGVGVRLAVSKAATRQELLTELRRCGQAAISFFSAPHNRWGNLSLVAGVGVLFVLHAGFSARRTIPVSAAIPLALLLLMFSLYVGVLALQRKPRSTAICALCLSAYGLYLFVSAVWRTGLEGILEEWL